MINISLYLKELVETNRRVILPDLGAFLQKEDNKGTKTVIFSSFLRYNDGFLEDYVVGKVQANKSDVSVAVRKFVNEVTKAVRSKKRYIIEDFGYFIEDKRGVQFVPYEDKLFFKEEEQKEAVKEDISGVDVIGSDNEPVFAADNAQNKTVNSPVIEIKTKPYKVQIKNIVDKNTKKRNHLLWIIIFLLVIIVFLLTMLYLCTTNSDLCFLRKKQVTKEQNVSSLVVSSINNDIVDNDSVKMLVSPSSYINKISYYQVIAGCFSEKINAERFLQYLLEQGYTSAELLPKIGELYPVCIGKSSDFKEAEKLRSTYNDKYNEDAWLYRTY